MAAVDGGESVLTVPRGLAPAVVTDAQVAQFQSDGFLVVPGMFTAEEAALLHTASKADERAQAHNEETQKRAKIWFPGDDQAHDVYTAICRCSRMVDTLERLIGDEVWLCAPQRPEARAGWCVSLTCARPQTTRRW